MAGGTLKAPALRYVELTVRKSSAGKGFAGQLHITTRSTWRYYGFLAVPCRERQSLCRRLLAVPEPIQEPKPSSRACRSANSRHFPSIALRPFPLVTVQSFQHASVSMCSRATLRTDHTPGSVH